MKTETSTTSLKGAESFFTSALEKPVSLAFIVCYLFLQVLFLKVPLNPAVYSKPSLPATFTPSTPLPRFSASMFFFP